MRCNFTEAGVELKSEIGQEEKYIFLPAKLEGVQDYLQRLNIIGGIFATLNSAHLAMTAGRGLYDDARNNVRNLLTELQEAAQDAKDIARDVGVFFDPPGLGEKLDGTPEDMIRFALSAMKQLEAKLRA